VSRGFDHSTWFLVRGYVVLAKVTTAPEFFRLLHSALHGVFDIAIRPKSHHDKKDYKAL